VTLAFTFFSIAHKQRAAPEFSKPSFDIMNPIHIFIYTKKAHERKLMGLLTLK